jgi:hypothetical protein
MINSMIDDYLKKNPKEVKTQETKEMQDEKDPFSNKVVSFQVAKKMKKEHDDKIATEKKNNKNKKPQAKGKKDEEDKKEEGKKEEDKEEAKVPIAGRNNIQCKN